MSLPPSHWGHIRWKIPTIILILTALAITAVHQREWFESYQAAWSTVALCILCGVLLLAWFVLLSGLTWRVRWQGLLAAVILVDAAILFVTLTTRVDGVINGVGIPRLVWKWSPRSAADLSGLPAGDILIGPPVDLTATTPQDFYQFLGPNRDNRITGAGLSRDWQKNPPRIIWKEPIGVGWSAFAIVGAYAVTQEQRGATEVVACYEVSSGKIRWQHVHANTRFSEWQGGDGPRATPTISQGRVYAMGASGNLDCLDGATGHEIWSRQVLANPATDLPTYGKSCSPLLVNDKVIVTAGHHGPSLVAFDKISGSLLWQAGNETPGYASPVVATLAGTRQIVTINAGSVTAHALEDGHELWRFDWPGTMPKNTNSIPLEQDRVLISAGYGLGTLMLQIKSSGGSYTVQPLWRSRHLKPKFQNLVINGNCVYGLDDGVLTCLDLSTGNRMWRGAYYGFGQILLVDDLLLVQQEEPGDLVVVDSDPREFHELGRCVALQERTWTGPALSGHRVLVRNDHEAACVELP